MHWLWVIVGFVVGWICFGAYLEMSSKDSKIILASEVALIQRFDSYEDDVVEEKEKEEFILKNFNYFKSENRLF